MSTLTDMLAGEHGTPPEERGAASADSWRKNAAASLKAAHEAMARGQYEEACDRMGDWQEHMSKRDYNQPSPGQKDAEGDDDLSDLLVVAPEPQPEEKAAPRAPRAYAD